MSNIPSRVSHIVMGEELLQFIHNEMNVGCDLDDPQMSHESVDSILSIYEMGCTADELRLLIGSDLWQTFPVTQTEEEDQIAELIGQSVDLDFGRIHLIDDRWLVLIGDNGMDAFYFVFRKYDDEESRHLLKTMLRWSKLENRNEQ